MDTKDKCYFIATEIGLGSGGIQTWAFYIVKLLRENNMLYGYYSKKGSSFGALLKLVRANFACRVFILMDWQKFVFALPALVLTSLGLKKASFAVFILGNEILNTGGLKKYIIRRLVKSRHVYFISDSKGIAAIFQSHYGRAVDLNCYPFIDCEAYAVRENGATDETQGHTFFTVSRLVKRKNVAGVIRALKRLKTSGFRFRYYVAGDGPEVDTLRGLIEELDLQEEVKLLGAVTEEKKMALFKGSDLFLLPSIYDEEAGSIEGFGIVFIESNLFGVPVIMNHSGQDHSRTSSTDVCIIMYLMRI